MTIALAWLWPISGWLCGYLSTPKWMFRDDPAGYVILFFCGAIVGPFGVFWFILNRDPLLDAYGPRPKIEWPPIHKKPQMRIVADSSTWTGRA